LPPSLAGSVGGIDIAGQDRPRDISADELNALRSRVALAARATAAPTQAPPARGLRVQRAGTNWQNNQVINALWSINQDRNSWVGVANVGWVKLSTASETGIMALSILAAHAKQLGSSVNLRQEDDQMIHEMYVW
jgi:hypothetical protein